MFTGIVSAEEKVQNVSRSGANLCIRIKKPAGWKPKRGESVNINGVCSTIKSIRKDAFEVEYMPETIHRTNAASLKKGSSVNLERSLRVNGTLDGHFVQGHVDTTGKIIEVKKKNGSAVLKIQFPSQYKKFIAAKGSICVNGVSLTVVSVGKDWCTVSLVRYTLEHTNVRNLKKGDGVNLETDIIARYLAALLKK